MKTYLSVLCLLFSLASAAQDFDNSGVYMSHIGKQQENISKKYMSYTSASAHGKRERKVQSLREKLLNEIQEARMNINSMPSYKGDKAYRDSAVSFMKLYFSIMNDDYAKVINMEEIAEQSYDEMEAYLLLEEKIQERLELANERMQAAQKDFAAKYNITLRADDSELGQMMKESAGVGKYYHQVYLVFFKPFVQQKNLTDAINANNMVAAEQSRAAMKKYAEEGLGKLPAIKAYKGDNSLVRACTVVLKGYVKDADRLNVVSDYFLAKEKFEKIKKEMEKGRSKETVDAYNKAVPEINKAGDNYNRTMKEVGEGQKANLAEWNSAVKAFYDTHTPHYK